VFPTLGDLNGKHKYTRRMEDSSTKNDLHLHVMSEGSKMNAGLLPSSSFTSDCAANLQPTFFSLITHPHTHSHASTQTLTLCEVYF